MSSSAKNFYVVLENPTYFEFDRDYILAATTLIDQVDIYLTSEYQKTILNNMVYAKQWAGLKEFGVNIIITETLPPSPNHYIKNPALINFDELVDSIVNLKGDKHAYR